MGECKNCGNKLEPNDKYCRKCGFKVETIEIKDKHPRLEDFKKRLPFRHDQIKNALIVGEHTEIENVSSIGEVHHDFKYIPAENIFYDDAGTEMELDGENLINFFLNRLSEGYRIHVVLSTQLIELKPTDFSDLTGFKSLLNKKIIFSENPDKIVDFRGVKVIQKEVDIINNLEIINKTSNPYFVEDSTKFDVFNEGEERKRSWSSRVLVRDHHIIEVNSSSIGIIPESMGYLSKLEKLLLYGNHIKSIPNSLGNLSSLEYLDLVENSISTLPESIKNLSSLKKLNLQGQNNKLDSKAKAIIEDLKERGVDVLID